MRNDIVFRPARGRRANTDFWRQCSHRGGTWSPEKDPAEQKRMELPQVGVGCPATVPETRFEPTRTPITCAMFAGSTPHVR